MRLYWPERPTRAGNIFLDAEGGEDHVAEFIRRITCDALVGNADMHLKNVSLIYPDRRAARLAPAYDLFRPWPTSRMSRQRSMSA